MSASACAMSVSGGGRVSDSTVFAGSVREQNHMQIRCLRDFRRGMAPLSLTLYRDGESDNRAQRPPDAPGAQTDEVQYNR